MGETTLGSARTAWPAAPAGYAGPRVRHQDAAVYGMSARTLQRRLGESGATFQSVVEEARRETRLTPAEAVEQMRINVPVRGNHKLRTLVERVNDDRQLKGWWHAANINAVVRMEINDHSWVHIQIVANIALKLLRQLTKHGVEPSLVRDYGMSRDDSEVVVVLGAPGLAGPARVLLRQDSILGVRHQS